MQRGSPGSLFGGKRPMLDVSNINTYYDSSHILFDVSLTINEGEVVGLLGRNGAGKSTTLRSIHGLTPPVSGRIKFKGKDVTGQKPHLLFRAGIGYVPDDRRVFADLSVDDNLEIVHQRKDRLEQREGVYSFPGAQSNKRQTQRVFKWWRTADAHHRPGLNGQP